MNYLISNKYVTQVFALNDEYELYGKSSDKIFNPIYEKKILGKRWKNVTNKFAFIGNFRTNQ